MKPLLRTAAAVLAASAMTLSVVQPAVADESGYFDVLTASASTTPGTICVESYLEPSWDVQAVTFDVALNGTVQDSITADAASSEFGLWVDPIGYAQCFDAAPGDVVVSAVATVLPSFGDALPVTVPVLEQTLTVAEVPPATVPATPAKPAVSASGTSAIKVKWGAVQDGGSALLGYQVRVHKGSALVRTVNSTSTAATISGLKLHTAYTVSVRAVNAVGYSSASPAAGIKLEVPGKPAKPAAAAKSVSSVGVAWKAPKSAGGPAITSYQVRIYQGSKVVKTVNVAPDKRSVTISGLKVNTKYTANVRAKNGVGYSVSSARAPFTTKNWSAAARWAAAKYGTFTSVTISGSGDDVITLPKGAKAGIISARYAGESNFIIEVQDSGGDMTDLPVNEIGAYSGTTVFGMSSWRGKPRQLEITASGDWKIQIRAVRTATGLPSSGTGDGVYLYGGGARRLALTHNGGSNFIVDTYASGLFGGDLLVNEIGSYRGTVVLKKGPAVIEVIAGGKWTTKLK